MNPKQVDAIIKAGERIKFRDKIYNEEFYGIPVSRGRFDIRIQLNSGHIGKFERSDLEVVKEK